MTDGEERPRLRQHLREMGAALGGIGKDVKIGISDAPHLAKEGTRNALARAAGVRRKTLEEWSGPGSEDRK
jgi:hypothetical protein